ncbi:MAG TPA: sigma factor-like helix-turn-helix DNA-binding protein [Candidatus Hydrogenedentes bacterium]|nr:sigma factor-like helix-turn-helix DNA-binding protein [Candidatus Hydrogenedentota bacterium]HOL77036.1 sigma factor-like helix-turn-helix DNA-binding protein [Candidatus Hydrogenedentota bacterium]HPO85781.1 sigma factor-like helix-turn-helix DNA-binding protein [Candidatus Hydrogenedentota bacterium]
MGNFHAAFWEIATDSAYLENVAVERGLWFETQEDRNRRYAFRDFFRRVMPVVREVIASELTPRQRQIVNLYYFHNMRQEEIAAALKIGQSTVSRHLFGTVRNGKRIGGAIPKLQRAVARMENGRLRAPLAQLERDLLASAS